MKYKVGSYREFKEFTLAVARGKRKVEPDEPKKWFESDETAQHALTRMKKGSASPSAGKNSKTPAALPPEKSSGKDLRQAERVAAINKHVQGGVPVFRGTRIPIHMIAKLLSQGETVESLRKGYPRLTDEMIRLAPIYAGAHPLRGRPRKRVTADSSGGK